ncbi:WSC-domain-containing protein [Trichodelitschia bisporula]|uniref:WSC-domain-containing protein n=1 Tax=Trichodelitschia bisporula TaxID=703511 RepID=A0A6G1I840_9PEZI|nr:WSC-domain-containing protein [Trichodelitschia bisporula]
MSRRSSTTFALVACLLGEVGGFWRMNCANIQLGRIDPIVAPGKVAGHVHTAQGGANDKSTYWTPLLYYQFANGSLINVKQTGSVLYYIGRGTNKSNIVPFPPGFRMISGSAAARSYQVNNVPKEPGGRFVLSTGDPTGYSFHGDFQNGWNQTTLAAALQSCASNPNSSGDINECPTLVNSYVKNYNQRCPLRPQQVVEPVTGLMPKLPGCINIVNGPAPAQPSDMNCPNTVVPPTLLETPESTPLPVVVPNRGQPFGLQDWTYVGCSNDTLNGQRVLSALTFTNTTNMTVQMCQAYCTAGGYKYAGLEIGNQCFCDNYLLNNPVINTGSVNQGMCYYQCPGNKLNYCGGQARLDIYNNTASAQLPFPSVQPVSGTYTTKGCYKEAASGYRALSGASLANNNMTVDVCAKYCLGRLFNFFGVEYGRECYCGASLNSTGAAPDSDCVTRCMGNSGQTQSYCGGNSRLILYYSSTL